ncbi:GAD-like domain-containing protein [Stenotrophomonas maltophilia]|uniref:GAD-like domain-containing protein n=1 Tax=Stenotrophomonas maltophilia TaxID=40324 RepID=UPI00137473BD|nr:GAD-like domain-containing protein [Stenotrophomonas maltophilia]
MQPSDSSLASTPLTEAEIEALDQSLPVAVRGLLMRRGRSTFKGGRIQLCHPHDLSAVMELVLADDPDLSPQDTHAYAYSAFGVIHFTHALRGIGQIDLLKGAIYCKGLTGAESADDIAQSATSTFRLPDDSFDLVGPDGQPLFEAAVIKLGPVGVGQCYAPSLPTGLSDITELDSLQLVDALPYFLTSALLTTFQLLRVTSTGAVVPVERRFLARTVQKIANSLSPECPFKVVQYKDIAAEVPEDSIYAGERFTQANELVLLVDGDLTLDTLDLDDPLAPWREEDLDEYIRFILVRGNAEIARHVHSLETDGACGLLVSGDLTTTNAIVGGQEIRVGGNLLVRELFWGDYNHGELHVVGDTKAALLIQTDYSMQFDGSVQCIRRMDDEAIIEDEIEQIIEPDCLSRECEDADSVWSLDAGAMLERLTAGKSVIRAEGLSAPDPLLCTVNLFGDATVSPDNFLRICAEDMLPLDTCGYDFHRDGISLQVRADTKDAGDPAYIIQMEDPSANVGARFVMERVETTVGLIDRLKGRRPETGWGLWNYICRDINSDQSEWAQVEAHEIPPAHVALVLKAWQFLQEGASSRHWTAEVIPAREIRDLLALEICKPYDNYDDDDRCGFWVGHCHAAFRQQEQGPDPVEPTLRLSRELNQPDGTSVIESYYFDVETCMDGTERVRIRYKADQELEDAPTQLDPVGGAELAGALRLYKRGAREMRGANIGLLRGRTPYFAKDHAFAMNFWRQQGYLSE